MKLYTAGDDQGGQLAVMWLEEVGDCRLGSLAPRAASALKSDRADSWQPGRRGNYVLEGEAASQAYILKTRMRITE